MKNTEQSIFTAESNGRTVALMRRATDSGVLQVLVSGKRIKVWLKGALIGTGELAWADSLREIITGGVRWHQSRDFKSPYYSNSISEKCVNLIDEAHRKIRL